MYNLHKFQILILAAALLTSCAVDTPLPKARYAAPSQGMRQAGILREVLEELSRIFRTPLNSVITVVVLPSPEFEKTTGAKSNVSALYFNGTIFIHAQVDKNSDLLVQKSAIRHEAVHAAVDMLSNGQCAAWLEEGLAQIFAGRPPRSLAETLDKAIEKKSLPQLVDLGTSFLLLSQKQQASSYALSRFAVRRLINSHGLEGIRNYLLLRQNGQTHDNAFLQSFSVDEKTFNEQLSRQLERWNRSVDTIIIGSR